jgi:hypothetical protein
LGVSKEHKIGGTSSIAELRIKQIFLHDASEASIIKIRRSARL